MKVYYEVNNSFNHITNEWMVSLHCEDNGVHGRVDVWVTGELNNFDFARQQMRFVVSDDEVYIKDYIDDNVRQCIDKMFNIKR